MSARQKQVVKVSSRVVLEALRKSTVLNAENSRSPCAVLEEVRNGTGYARSERYADALFVSLWPSRGIWFAGVEIKVSRSDWLSELKAPAKAAEILQWCDYWWLATAAGVANEEEIPDKWGWIEVTATEKTVKCAVRKKAPRLEPSPPSRDFVASVLRNVAAQEDTRNIEAHNKALRTLIENKVGIDGAEVERLRRIEADHGRLQAELTAFCAASGESLADVRFHAEELGRARALAWELVRAHGRGNSWKVPEDLRALADKIEAAEAELNQLRLNGNAALKGAFSDLARQA